MLLERPSVCLVTRARGSAGSQERSALVARLAGAAAAGASMIQVRERQFDDRALVAFVREVLGAARGTACRVLVNERTDVALAAGADGVHLKSDAVSVADVRRIVRPGMLVGRSIHSTAEAVVTEQDGGCDYLFFGTVFPSSSKSDEHPVVGSDALRRVCERVSLPVVAIGGITVGRAAEVTRAGAAGVAAISLFAEASNLAQLVSALRDALTVNPGNV